jgi:multidrug efflux pump subunit AcrA (membrane-fusion protein)
MRSGRGPRNKWLLYGIGIAILLVGSAWLLATPATRPAAAAGDNRPLSQNDSPANPILTAPAQSTTLVLRATAAGKLEAWRKVEVHSELAGVVVDAPSKEGVAVAKGAVLASLDDSELRIRLAQIEAEWLKRQASYSLNYVRGAAPAEGEAARPAAGGLEELDRRLAAGLISRDQYESERRRHTAESFLAGDKRLEVQAAVSGLTQAEQDLTLARLHLAKCRVLAPFAGRVANLKVIPGQRVDAGQLMMTLLDDHLLRAEVLVLESDLVHLAVGSPARLRIPSLGRELAGTVHAINPQIDPGTGTGRVAIEVENPGSLLMSGLYVTVELAARSLPDQIVVPRSAVLSRQGRDLVFRVVGERVEWTYVEVGEQSGDLVAVRGLASGDLVAIQGHDSLAHGARVEVASPVAAGGE